MSRFFIPYSGDAPAAIDIKGHRILIVSSDPDEVLEGLDRVGADSVKEVDLPLKEAEALADLASRINGGVVLAPPGADFDIMIDSLERELPWIH